MQFRQILFLCFFLASTFILMPNASFAKDEKANFNPYYTIDTEEEINTFRFTILERGKKEGMKILVLGGIQGDEPGAFSAASLLSTHYTFSNANIVIIPNLNLPSIVARERGTFGDMNRKFAQLEEDDPQYHEVKRLQKYILEFQPDIILNLHDGSGFYSEEYVSKLRNPYKWGQSTIIDQESIDSPYGNLLEIAEKVVEEANKDVNNPDYYFTVHNTHTNKGNAEMEKTLTWFGVKNNIASYGLEVSKELNAVERAYYHLVQLEAFFAIYNIAFERSFPLRAKNVQKALESELFVSFANDRIVLPLKDIKDTQLGYIPLPKEKNYTSTQTILLPIQAKDSVKIHHGNNLLTEFKTKEYPFSEDCPKFFVTLPQSIEIDGEKVSFEKTIEVEIGDILPVEKSFNIAHQEGYRINAIGARKEKKIGTIMTEANVQIEEKHFDKRYAIDEDNSVYRIEIYKGKEFVGMFLADFS